MHAGRTILVTDDDESFRSLVREVIETELGRDVVEASNGQEALDALRAGLNPELLVCDVRMPVMDGLEMLQHIRGDKELAQLRVVLCSTVHDRSTIIEAAHLAVAGYVLKPFETPTLVSKLNEVLRSREEPAIDGGLDALRIHLGVTREELSQVLGWLIEDAQQALDRCRQASAPTELHYRLIRLRSLADDLRARALQHAIESALKNLANSGKVLRLIECEVKWLINHARSLR